MLASAQINWNLIGLAALFLLLVCAEFALPRRKLIGGRRRWLTHFGFFAINSAIGRLIAAISVVAAAACANRHELGFFANVAGPDWLKILLALIIYDFAVWFQHVALHRIPLFWRAHRVHHSDRDLDVTTALRFHPFELLLSTAYKSLVVVGLGVPVSAAIAFEFWLNANALFNHSNIALPRWLDRGLRQLIVTPDMHLVHHSIDQNEQNRNFGFGLIIWDKTFHCYQEASILGRENMIIGLDSAQTDQPVRLDWSLLLPFRNK
jgi:sterol desaturase/sphingolipid hydroxylase (fatty acid hydroxylase superfamily)